MKYEIYADYVATGDLSVFEFTSVGIKGSVKKRVAFTSTERQGVYNLGFGDLDENDEIDDYKVTNNGDRNKILAPVVTIVESTPGGMRKDGFSFSEVLKKEPGYMQKYYRTVFTGRS